VISASEWRLGDEVTRDLVRLRRWELNRFFVIVVAIGMSVHCISARDKVCVGDFPTWWMYLTSGETSVVDDHMHVGYRLLANDLATTTEKCTRRHLCSSPWS